MINLFPACLLASSLFDLRKAPKLRLPIAGETGLALPPGSDYSCLDLCDNSVDWKSIIELKRSLVAVETVETSRRDLQWVHFALQASVLGLVAMDLPTEAGDVAL